MPSRLTVAALSLIFSIPLSAQTITGRAAISDGKGYDYAPMIAKVGASAYGVVWSRVTGEEATRAYGRLVGADARPQGGQRANLIGVDTYRWSRMAAASRPEWGLLLVGSVRSTGGLVSRVLDAKLKPFGTVNTTMGAGNNPVMAPVENGFILAWTGLDQHGQIQKIDIGGYPYSNSTSIQTASASTFLAPSAVVVSPAGGYCVAGTEMDDAYTRGRAAGAYAPDTFPASVKSFPYESPYSTEGVGSDLAFYEAGGLLLFHHQNAASQMLVYTRAIKANGKASGAARKISLGGSTSTLLHRIIPLPGLHGFLIVWADPGAGHIYMQRLSANGSPEGTPVAVTQTAYAAMNESIDVAWFSDVNSGLVAWSERANSQSTKTKIWVARFTLD